MAAAPDPVLVESVAAMVARCLRGAVAALGGEDQLGPRTLVALRRAIDAEDGAALALLDALARAGAERPAHHPIAFNAARERVEVTAVATQRPPVAAAPPPAPPLPAPTPTPPEEEAKDDESPAAPEDVAEEDESLAPVLKKLCVSTCEVTFILVFPYDAVDLYAVEYMDYRARIVKWTNRNAGYVGETVCFLSTKQPEFTLEVAVGAKLGVYDPIGCALCEPFVAFHDVVEYVEMGTGTIAARDAARTVSVDAAAALYIAPGGPRTTVPSSWAATDCRYPWFGGLFDCDGSLSVTVKASDDPDMLAIKAEVIIEQRLSRNSLPFMAWAANEMGTDAKMYARLSNLYDVERGDDAREYVGVRVKGTGPKALEFLKKLEPHVGIKLEVGAAVEAAEHGLLFQGCGSGNGLRRYSGQPKDAVFWRAIGVRSDLVAFCARVKTEAGQLSEDELRARMPYRRTGVVDVARLGAYFGGLVSGDACASRGFLEIAQSYKAFLNVVSEDLNAAFGTDFRVYESSKTGSEHTKKTPFKARSARTAANEAGNKKLARAALGNMPMCDESKRAALQRIIDGAAK